MILKFLDIFLVQKSNLTLEIFALFPQKIETIFFTFYFMVPTYVCIHTQNMNKIFFSFLNCIAFRALFLAKIGFLKNQFGNSFQMPKMLKV